MKKHHSIDPFLLAYLCLKEVQRNFSHVKSACECRNTWTDCHIIDILFGNLKKPNRLSSYMTLRYVLSPYLLYNFINFIPTTVFLSAVARPQHRLRDTWHERISTSVCVLFKNNEIYIDPSLQIWTFTAMTWWESGFQPVLAWWIYNTGKLTTLKYQSILGVLCWQSTVNFFVHKVPLYKPLWLA